MIGWILTAPSLSLIRYNIISNITDWLFSCDDIWQFGHLENTVIHCSTFPPSTMVLIYGGTWSTEQMLGAHCQGLPHVALVWNLTMFTGIITAVICCCAADRSGGFWRGPVRPERYQELSDSHPRPGISLSDPHHQRAGETADDRWWDFQLCLFTEKQHVCLYFKVI